MLRDRSAIVAEKDSYCSRYLPQVPWFERLEPGLDARRGAILAKSEILLSLFDAGSRG